MCFLVGCSLISPVKNMAEYELKDSSIIQLRYLGGGATAPSGIWIKRISKNGSSYYAGNIDDFNYTYKVEVSEIDSIKINIRLIDTTSSVNKYFDFIINLGDTLHPSGPFLN